jgi:hypothetical protein
VLGGRRAITAYDLAAGVIAFIATTPTTLREVFVRGADDVERQLTDLGATFLAAVPPAEPEHFTVPSPAGDVALDAWIVRPPDAGERVPVLLSIHGGPMTQYANAWFDEFQLLAGAGYAVVYTNPHQPARLVGRVRGVPARDPLPGGGGGAGHRMGRNRRGRRPRDARRRARTRPVARPRTAWVCSAVLTAAI